MADQRHIRLFQLGKDVWNAWAKTDQATIADFSKIQFQKTELNFDGFYFPKGVDFTESRIQGPASFRDCKFGGPVIFIRNQASSMDFSGSVFSEKLQFILSSNGDLNFSNVIFSEETVFSGTTADTINFTDAEFKAKSDLQNLNVQNGIIFTNTTFIGTANFSNCKFNNGSTFEGVKLLGGADFNSATFQVFNFDGAVFDGEISFAGATSLPAISMQKITLKRDGKLTLSDLTFNKDVNFSGSKFFGDFDFGFGTVEGKCSFRDCTFSGVANFKNRVFQSGTSFAQSKFRSSSKPNFENANFADKTSFQGAEFNTPVSFRNSEFHNEPIFFEKTKFKKPVEFQFVEFHAPASFVDAQFKSAADFRSMNSKYEFDLSGACFSTVPNFLFAQFTEPPSFEGVEVSSPLGEKPTDQTDDPRKGFLRRCKIASGPEISHRFRKLKSLAIAGHDHRLEMDFFAGEIQAKRFWHDKPGSGAFNIGFLYQWFSDFGRSLARPFSYWVVMLFFFNLIYFLTHCMSAWTKCGSSWVPPMWQAFMVSVTQSLPFLFWGRSESLKPAIECLYGQTSLPLGVAGIAIVQNILSTMLIFLLFLAMRNQFKIK